MKSKWLLPFMKYCNKVYGFSQRLNKVHDRRKGARIPTKVVIGTIFAGIACGANSLLRIEELSREGVYSKFVGTSKLVGRNAMSGVLEKIYVADFRAMLEFLVKKARHNGVFRGGTVGNLVVAAIDGTQTFSSKCKDFRLKRNRTVKERVIEERYEFKVSCSLVGNCPPLEIGFTMMEPGENEITAAKRFLKYLFFTYTHFADVIVADAMYAKSTIINMVLDAGMDMVVRIKNEKRELIKDALGIFAQRKPTMCFKTKLKRNGKKYRAIVKLWDEENFEWEKITQTMRVVKLHLTLEGEDEVIEEDVYLATTISRGILDGRGIWRIYQARWEIENRTFHHTKTYGTLTHCFCSDGNAIEAMLYIQSIIHNYVQLFMMRNRKRDRKPALAALKDLFLSEIRLIPRPYWRLAPSGI